MDNGKVVVFYNIDNYMANIEKRMSILNKKY